LNKIKLVSRAPPGRNTGGRGGLNSEGDSILRAELKSAGRLVAGEIIYGLPVIISSATKLARSIGVLVLEATPFSCSVSSKVGLHEAKCVR